MCFSESSLFEFPFSVPKVPNTGIRIYSYTSKIKEYKAETEF